MNAAHLHLVTNHIPIVGMPVALLVVVIGHLLRDGRVRNVGFFLAVVFALASIVVFLSGEGAEEIIEKVAAESEHAVEAHEEAAETAFVVILVTGGLALLRLIASAIGARLAGALAGLAVAGLVLSTALLVWTANLGGKIRHPEIENDTSLSAPYEDVSTIPSTPEGYDEGDTND